MTTLFRAGAVETSRIAFGKANTLNTVVVKPKYKLTKEKCPLPIIGNPKSMGPNNLFSVPSAVTSMFGQPSQVRWSHSHTDITFPDYTPYRQESGKDPTKRAIETDESRKILPYMAYGAGGMIGLYMTKYLIRGFVEYKSPPRSMLSMASIEINLADIPEGKSGTYMWRGKPVFVRHRTREQIQREQAVDVASLRHPESDADRTKVDEKWLVVVGICTHLGCVPTANQGNFGGYYCPCHGSHYDMSGRIRQGPAPLNLQVPEKYEIIGNRLIVG